MPDCTTPEENGNVIPFRGPSIPEAIDPCDECVLLPEDCCESPDAIGEEARGEEPADVTFGDLAFTAERLIMRHIEGIDWSQFKPAADLLFDDSDARTVIHLMKYARIEVTCG